VNSVGGQPLAAICDEPYAPGRSGAYWEQHDPPMLEFLRSLESREGWVTTGRGEAEPKLVELITYLPTSGPMPPAGLVGLMRILSAMPFGESVHALLWMDVRNAPAVRDVMNFIYENRGTSASANIMWQRLERVARFHVLSGLVADVVSEHQPTGSDIAANDRDRDPGNQSELVRSGSRARRLCVLRDDETLPFLQQEREISSLNEVDELFGNRRFYLLTEDLELCRTLASHGVGVDQYGGYVTRGPACDFEYLDHLLPFVARRSIRPLFGDLIPYSSWASNLERLLTRGSWDRVRRRSVEATGHRCEICGVKETQIDSHEKWEYHEPIVEGARGIQKLVGLWAMCSACHATQHLGRANSTSRDADALERLRRIGRMSEREAQAYRAFVFDRCRRRSKVDWMLDVSTLAGPEPLVVQGGWTLDEDGFLTRQQQINDGKTLQARTMLLGASWTFSAKGSRVYPARAVHDGYYG